MTTLETKLEIKSWDEQPYRELPDGQKYTRAEVVLVGTGSSDDGAELTEGNFESLMHYRVDGTTTYVVLMSLVGTLDGRQGSMVLVGEGSFDGTTAQFDAHVVDATGDLVGLTCRATSASTHADYPHMPLTLKYAFA